MASFAATILQLALALLMSVQTNTTATEAQRQQAISVATQAIQLAVQANSQTQNSVGVTSTASTQTQVANSVVSSTEPSLSATSSTTPGTATALAAVSLCNLQNNPTTYLSQKINVQGVVRNMSGTNYYATSTVFYLENEGCKIQVSAWAPLEIAACPPSNSVCTASMTMQNYVGKWATLYGTFSQMTGNIGNPYVFMGDLVSDSGVGTVVTSTGSATVTATAY
jgi:hypothetical protein